MKLFELVKPTLNVYTGHAQWKAAAERMGAKPEIEPHQNKRQDLVIGARKNGEDVGVWTEVPGFKGGIVFKTPEEFTAWNKKTNGDLVANLKNTLKMVTMTQESQETPASKKRFEKLQDALGEITDIVGDHMEKTKPSKYISQINDLIEKATGRIANADMYGIADLEDHLRAIGKIADQNPDSEHEGGRAVNPNDELRISTIVDNVL